MNIKGYQKMLLGFPLLFYLTVEDGLATDKPNIIVIMTDDQGRWSLEDYDSRIATPNISYLAEQGVRFDQAISPTPVCSAARASFYTGMTASQHGVHDFLSDVDSDENEWLAGEILISEELSRQGYQVGLFGKWHATTRGWKPVRGFDRWLTYDERESDWSNQYQHSGTVYFSSDGKATQHTGVQARFVTEEAVRFIDDSNVRPFAAFINYVEPHFPFSGLPDRLVTRYRPIANKIVAAGDSSGLSSSNDELADGVMHAEKLAQYLAAVTLVDEQVGRILDALVGRELINNTLIIFTSDHGHMTGQYGLYGKGNASVPQNFYDVSINIPLVITGPNRLVSPGQVRNDFVNLYDIFPTLLEIAAAEDALSAYGGPGKSLVPLLKGKRLLRFKEVQIAEMGNGRMVHDGCWKLVRYYHPDRKEPDDIWFDLAHPLGERWPVAAPSEEQQKRLEVALADFFNKYSRPENNGTRIWELPRHNRMEPWRRMH